MGILQDKLKRADLLLLLLYITYCGVIILRVNIEGTGYTSPDSEYYLEAARSLKDGEGFVIRDLYGLHRGVVDAKVYYAQWPIGYPTLITAAAWVSGLDLFWASKVINLLFAGLGFLLLRYINRAYSFLLASIYGAFTIIEMYSYTWSECIFIFGCLCLVTWLYKSYKTASLASVYGLLVIAAFMFLMRYIGFFSGGLILLLAFVTWREGRRRLSSHVFIVFVLNVIIVWAYVLHNYHMAGYNTDAQRLTQDMEHPAEVVWMTIKGLTIELFLIKKFYLRGAPDMLTVVTFMLQLGVMGYIWWLLKKDKALVISSVKANTLSQIAVITALAYLAVLVFLRSISQFDPPNYRLLSPFTFLMLFALVNCIVALPDKIKNASKVKYLTGGFFLLSLVLNLPKKFLISYFL